MNQHALIDKVIVVVYVLTVTSCINVVGDQNGTMANSPSLIVTYSPENESINIPLIPLTTITILDPDNDTMTVKWLNNVTGDWEIYGTNASISDGTYGQIATWAATMGKRYWWRVNVSDGNETISATYVFTTRAIETFVNPIVPYNTTTDPLTISVNGSENLSNVTLFYRFNTVNSSLRYLTSLTEQKVFRNRVDSMVFDYPNDIDIINGIGYIVSFNNHSLVILNATNDSLIVQTAYKQDVTYLRSAHGIAVTSDSKYAYTINYRTNSYLCMWDVSDVSKTPVRLNQVYLPGETGMYLEISGNYLFLTTKSKIHIYDITDRNTTHAMTELCRLSYSTVNATTYYWHPLVIGNFLYVTTAHGSVDGGFVIYNITDKENPTEVRRVNESVNFIELRQYLWHGFHYLISMCKEKPASFYIGYIYIYNISSGTLENPKFLLRKCTIHNSSWFAAGAFCDINGYIFCEQKNYNKSINSGIQVWNLTDINNPSYITTVYGNGAPNYLNLCHDMEFDLNQSDRTLYILTQTDDSLVTMKPTWVGTSGPPWSSWTTFESPDTTFPWLFSFAFPNNTGYYEFYSIGQKSGEPPEEPPSEKDAMTRYTNQSPAANFSYTPNHPRLDDIIQFFDTSVTPGGWVVNWTWDFGDGNTSYAENPPHQYTAIGNYSVTLLILDSHDNQSIITKKVEVKEPLVLHSAFVFGRITDLNTDGKYLMFNAVNTKVIIFRPASVSLYVNGEQCIITQDYQGILIAHFIFVFCQIAVETTRTLPSFL